MKFYISGALQGSACLRNARNLYEETAQCLEGKGIVPFLPHKQTDPVHAAQLSSAEVYERDRKALNECAAIIAFLDEPSHGVGAEIAICLERKMPMLPMARQGRKCSRFLEGLICSCGLEIVRYGGMSDIDRHLDDFILRFQNGFLEHPGGLSRIADSAP